jgi:hypothetical protein
MVAQAPPALAHCFLKREVGMAERDSTRFYVQGMQDGREAARQDAPNHLTSMDEVRARAWEMSRTVPNLMSAMEEQTYVTGWVDGYVLEHT